MRYQIKISWFYFIIAITLITTFFNILIVNEELVKANLGITISTLLLGTSNNTVIFSLLFFSRTLTKLWVILLFVISAVALFFIRNYGIEMSYEIIQVAISTDSRETYELIDFVLLFYIAMSLVIAISICYFCKIKKVSFLNRLKQFGFAIGVAVVLLIIPHAMDRSGGSLSQKEVKKYFAPMNFIDSTFVYLKYKKTKRIIPVHMRHRLEHQYQFEQTDTAEKIFVLVIGESARGDHIQLNGYERPTTPRLQRRDNIISYTKATSCSTRTIFSVPCILSHLDLEDFSLPAKHTSLISILRDLGFETYYFSKHRFAGANSCIESEVCLMRLELEEQYKHHPNHQHDEILFEPLDDVINKPGVSKLIVMNTMGSHFNYDDRIPNDSFKKFIPLCGGSVYSCDNDALINSYDNTMVYLDYFLDTLYSKLENKNAMVLYTSDHGESLGEFGIYAHSKPNFIAPKEQRHVPMILWMSKQFSFFESLSKAFALRTSDQPVSHNNVFHSVLDCLGIKSDLIDRNKSFCFNEDH